MNYGEVLRDAFYVMLRNRFLWVFGVFIAGASIVTPSNLGAPASTTAAPGQPPAWAEGLLGAVEQNPVLYISLFVAGFIGLFVLSLAVVTLCRGALAEAVAAMDRGERRGFGSTLRAGLANFWRVFFQSVILFLISLAALLLIGGITGGLAAAAFVGSGSVDSSGARAALIVLGALAILLLVLLFTVFAVVFNLITQLALRDLVVGRSPIGASIRNGYRLFRRNLGKTLLLLVIQIAIGLGVGIGLALLAGLLGLALSLPVNALSETSSVVVAVAGSIILSLPMLVLSGAFGTFNHAYWTLAYLRLSGGPVAAGDPAPPDSP